MKTLLWCCCWTLLLASSLSSPTPSVASQHPEDEISAPQNSTAVASSPVDGAVSSDNDASRAADSGELTGGDRGEDDGGGGTPSGRVAELYEDLDDSVVFEDSDGHGGGASVADTSAAHHPVAAADGSDASVSTEEDDASPAGTSPVGHVLQRSVKYPEYVRSSSYRRGWPGGNVTRPEELFRFWDPYEWTSTPAVSSQCVEHVLLYQAALRSGKMWAFKSEFVTSYYRIYLINTYVIRWSRFYNI